MNYVVKYGEQVLYGIFVGTGLILASTMMKRLFDLGFC